MTRAVFMVGLLALTMSTAFANVDESPPPITRETLVGTWEGVVGLGLHGSHPIVFHILIAPRNEDSYMAEIYPEHLGGSVYRLQTCTVTDGKVYLRFQELSGREWWFEGAGYGDTKTAWLEASVGTGYNARGSGSGLFYFAKGAWVRNFGEASRRGEEKIAEAQAAKK